MSDERTQNGVEGSVGSGGCFKDGVVGEARKALKAQGISVPCSTVSYIQSCKKKLSEKETFDLIKNELKSNLDKGQNGLEAISNAAQTALNEGAHIGDVIDALATKKSLLQQIIGGGYAPPSGGIGSGLNSQIDDGTENSGHIFAYIRYSYWLGKNLALLANERHDPPLEWGPKGSTDITKEDYVAGLLGASIGEKLSNGEVCLEEFDDFLKTQLGPNNPEIDQMTKEAENRRAELMKQRDAEEKHKKEIAKERLQQLQDELLAQENSWEEKKRHILGRKKWED